MAGREALGQIAWLLPLAAVSLAIGLWKAHGLARAGFTLFGVWAVVHVAVFSTQQGVFHPYYVSALAPAVAALAGMGLVQLWRYARASWAGAGLLAAAVAVTGAFALFAGPASYAVANLGHGLDGNNVLAGPSGVGAGGFGGGRGGPGGLTRGGTPPNGTPPRGASVSAELLAYLEANQGSAKYLLAATGSQTTAPIIIETGKAVVTIGGFGGRDNSPTVAQLEAMVAKGELKYVLASGNGAIDSWVQEHGTAVDGYDGLYRVTAA